MQQLSHFKEFISEAELLGYYDLYLCHSLKFMANWLGYAIHSFLFTSFLPHDCSALEGFPQVFLPSGQYRSHDGIGTL